MQTVNGHEVAPEPLSPVRPIGDKTSLGLACGFLVHTMDVVAVQNLSQLLHVPIFEDL